MKNKNNKRKPNWYRQKGKRICDIIIAGSLLIIIAPLFMVISIGISISSGFPIFFYQERIGQQGHPFQLYKFRTMVRDAPKQQRLLRMQNEAQGPFFKIKADPRVTKFGHFLRVTSLDELPQLVNVIKGNMSLVGPRPSLPKEVGQFKPWMYERLSIKPGLTGLWQIQIRKNEMTAEEIMKLDLIYVKECRLALDLKIIFQTIGMVITQRNE